MFIKTWLCGRRRSSSTTAVIRLLLLLFISVLVYYVYSRSPALQVHQSVVAESDRLSASVPRVDDPSLLINEKCGTKDMCKINQKVFKLVSGESYEKPPTICVNGVHLIGGANPELYAGRGMNVIIMDQGANKVANARNFDLFEFDSEELIHFLNSVKSGEILLAVTSDDAANQLSASAKNIFKSDFGSSKIDELNFRGNWVFIGQKGMSGVSYYEKVEPHGGGHDEWAKQIEIHGCLVLPVGQAHLVITDSPPAKQSQLVINDIPPAKQDDRVYDSTAKCELPHPCPVDTIAVNLKSGSHVNNQKVLPSVCVDGIIVMDEKTNTPGRGLNVLVLDPQTKLIKYTNIFDTYESETESGRVVSFIHSISNGYIVLVTVYDEASHQLTFEAKHTLESIGSGQIKDLDYRSTWSFIGQKGLDGISPYEQLRDRVGLGWGPHAVIKECIPRKIQPVIGPKLTPKNKRLEEFCRQYIGYGDFCSADNILKTLDPKPLHDETLKNNPAYTTPIIVIPGLDLNSLRKTLDSLLEVPGLKPDLVMVGHEGDFAEPNALTDLYGFKRRILQGTSRYQYHMHKAMEAAFITFPRSEYVIILEEQLEVSPDFLSYFAQTLPLLAKDSSIVTISAFNQNGFVNTSGDPSLLYRTENFPGLGWLLRKSTWYEMKDKLADCCDCRVWDEWLKGGFRKGREMIVPDVSRVSWFQKDVFSADQSFRDVYFANRRTIREDDVLLTDVDSMIYNHYEDYIVSLLKKSIVMDTSNAHLCLQGKGLGFPLPKGTGDIYTIFYEQSNEADQALLKILCKCYGLFAMDDYSVRGIHKGLLRFFYRDNQYMLIGSVSPYMEYTPDIKPITKLGLKT